MLGNLSFVHVLILLLIVVLVFGTSKLKNLGKDLGGAISGFKEAMREGEKEAQQQQQPQQPPALTQNQNAPAQDAQKDKQQHS